MWPDRVSNPGPLTYESGALPTALRSPAHQKYKSDTARTVRKSDYTPGLALSKHMASDFDEQCRQKEKCVLNRRKPVLNLSIQQVTVNLY